MDADELARQVAQAMLAAEGTGPAWGIVIEEARAGYARLSMTVRADMLNGHGIAHGGMVFALADTAFAYVCNGQERESGRGAGLDHLPRQRCGGRNADRRGGGGRAARAQRRHARVGAHRRRPRRSPNSPAIRARSAERSSRFERYASTRLHRTHVHHRAAEDRQGRRTSRTPSCSRRSRRGSRPTSSSSPRTGCPRPIAGR